MVKNDAHLLVHGPFERGNPHLCLSQKGLQTERKNVSNKYTGTQIYIRIGRSKVSVFFDILILWTKNVRSVTFVATFINGFDFSMKI
jgi:hypothetical protein